MSSVMMLKFNSFFTDISVYESSNGKMNHNYLKLEIHTTGNIMGQWYLEAFRVELDNHSTVKECSKTLKKKILSTLH